MSEHSCDRLTAALRDEASRLQALVSERANEAAPDHLVNIYADGSRRINVFLVVAESLGRVADAVSDG